MLTVTGFGCSLLFPVIVLVHGHVCWVVLASFTLCQEKVKFRAAFELVGGLTLVLVEDNEFGVGLLVVCGGRVVCLSAYISLLISVGGSHMSSVGLEQYTFKQTVGG